MEQKIEARLRAPSTHSQLKHMKREGIIPGIIYGKFLKENVNIYMNQIVASRLERAKLIQVHLDNGDILPVMMKSIDLDHINGKPVHIDLIHVTEKPIRLKVPVKFCNASKSLGLKFGGILNVIHQEILIEAEPQNIPSYFELNLEGAMVGKYFTIDDLGVQPGVRVISVSKRTRIASIIGKKAAVAKAAATAETKK